MPNAKVLESKKAVVDAQRKMILLPMNRLLQNCWKSIK